MNRCHVTFYPSNRRALVDEGATVLDAIRLAELPFDAPCGGDGACGKCMVNLLSGGEVGLQKACKTIVTGDMEVALLAAPERYTEAADDVPFSPLNFDPPIEMLGFTPDTHFLMAAFDIGTTSVVCYLLDGQTGKQLACASQKNPQSIFGADVLHRVGGAMRYGNAPLRKAILYSMNSLLETVCAEAGMPSRSILLSSVAGNTCMQHLFLDFPVSSLATPPYAPHTLEPVLLDAAVSGLAVDPRGKVLVFPSIGAFVGGDTVAGMLSTGFLSIGDPTLLIDIGTNGEIVLATKNRILACSAAAGPAFEGAHIRCGMRGSAGAVDHMQFDNGRLVYSTIDDKPAVGICGSGLVDAASALLSAGMLDYSGRMLRMEEMLSPIAIANVQRVSSVDGHPAFYLTKKSDVNGRHPVFVTQRDIRELQLAKSAIASGIALLMQTMDITIHQIWHVYIAGAFGNYLNPAAACAIGLLPRELQSKVKVVGNAAGLGARLVLCDRSLWENAGKLAAATEYVELSGHPAFQDLFIEHLPFPRSTTGSNIFGRRL